MPIPAPTAVPVPTPIAPEYRTLSDVPWSELLAMASNQAADNLQFFGSRPNLSEKNREVAEGVMNAQIQAYVMDPKHEVSLNNGSFEQFIFFYKGEINSIKGMKVDVFPKDVRVYALVPNNPMENNRRLYVFFFHNSSGGIVAAGWGDKSLAIPRYATGADSGSDSSGSSSDGGSAGGAGGDSIGGPVGGVGALALYLFKYVLSGG
jgi:hypothetical protein